MALKARGEDPDNSKKALGHALTPDGFTEPKDVDDAYEQLREHGGEGAVQAARLSVTAIQAYDVLESDPGNEQALRLLYETVDQLTALSTPNLRTVLVSGIVAMHALRKQNGI